jgi:branched-chain amino acid transport system permease protein
LAAIAATGVVGASGSAAFEQTIVTVLTSMTIVVGLQVFVGNSRVYSFGHIAFAAVGGYLAAILTMPDSVRTLFLPDLPELLDRIHLGSLAGTLVGALAAGVFAAILAFPLMRTSTLAIPISTLSLLVVVREVIANWDDVTGGTGGLLGVPKTTTVFSATIWAMLAVAAALLYKRSRSGYRLQASGENEVAAKSIGVGVVWERSVAFVLSALIVGVGGALVAHQAVGMTPSTFYFDLTIVTLTMLIVGGMGSVWGAVVGTIVVSAVNEVLRGIENGADLWLVTVGERPGLAPIGVSLILIATLIALPSGITRGKEANELEVARRVRARFGRARKAAPAPAPTTKASNSTTAVERPGELSAHGVSVQFDGITALDGVSLGMARGEILGLIGPNGAGKTTLVNVLSGYQRPVAGRVTLGRADTTGVRPHQLARVGLARSFQAALPFPHMTARENVAVGAMGVGRSKRSAMALAGGVLDRLGLAERADRLAGSLPAGEEKLLGIGRALATDPSFLLLDEPAAGLNEEEGESLVASLLEIRDEFGCGILIIEHNMSVILPLCERVHVLDGGRTLIEGTPDEVWASPAVVEAYFGTSVAASHA